MFRQTLHLPSSGWKCNAWAFWKPYLYRAESRLQKRFLRTFAVLRSAYYNYPILPFVRLSVCPYAWRNSRTDEPILTKFKTGYFHEKFSRHCNFHLAQTILTATLHKNINTFFELICQTSLLSVPLSCILLLTCLIKGPERRKETPNVASESLQIFLLSGRCSTLCSLSSWFD
jgi:hypothetical protein